MTRVRSLGGGFASWRVQLAVSSVLSAALILAVAGSSVRAATRTWTGLGPTNLWSDALNWSGNLVPGAADTATFDATSGKNATIAAAVNVAGLSIGAGYTGAITQNAGITVTVGATGLNQAGGTLVGGTSTITVNGPLAVSGGAFTATSGTLSVSGNFTLSGGAFTHNGGTVSFGGGAATLTVSTADTFRNVTHAAGTKTIAAGTTLTATGSVSLTAGSLNGTGTLAAAGDVSQALGYSGGAATLLLSGAGAQTLTGASTTASGNLPALVINKPSGTLTLAGTIRTTNSWTYTAGTLDPGSSTLVFAGGTITGSHTLNAVDLRATTSIAAGTTLTVAGSTTLTAGNLNGTGTLAAQGDVSQASTAGAGTATLAVTGTGAQTFTGAATTAAGNLPALVINKPSGTLTLAGTIRTTNSWTYTAGTVDAGTSTLVFAGGTITGSHSLATLDFRATTSIAAGTTLTATGSVSLTAGSLNGTGTLAAAGDVSQALGYSGGAATLLLSGAGAQTLTGASTTASGNLPALVINKPSGTLTLAGTIRTTNSWTYTAGTLDPGSSTLVFAGGTITGSHTLNAVDLRATTSIAAGTTLTVAGSTTLTAGNLNGTGTLAAQGDVSQASTAGAGTATLAVTGTGAQTFTGAATTAAGNLPALVINKPSGTLTLAGTIRTTNSWTYTAGTVDAGTSTLVFAGGTITGSHSLATLDFRATTSIAAGTTLTATGSVSLTAGSLNGTGTLAAAGDVSQALGYSGGAATLLLSGAGAQTLTGASTTASGNLPALVINKPSGTLTLAGTIRTTNSWTYTAGTLDPGSSTLVFAGGTITGSHTLNAVDLRATTSIAAGTTLTVAGSTTLTAGNLNGTGTLAAQGDVSQASTAGAGTATLAVTGTGAQTFTGAATTAAGNLPALVINKPSGTLTLAGTIRTTNSWTYTAGTVDAGTSTLVFAGGTVRSAGMTFYDLIANGGTTTLGTAMVVTHDLTVSAGTFTTSASGYGLTIGGNVTVVGTLRENGSLVAVAGNVTNNGTIVPATSTLLLDGYGGQALGGAVALPAFNLIVNDPLGVAQGANLSVTGTLTLTSGQLSIGAYLLTISNAIAGTLTNLVGGSTSSLTVTGAGSSIVVPTSVANLASLTLSNANGLGLQGDLTIAGTLTLTTGRLDAGMYTVVIGSGGSVVRTSGWVVGLLQKPAAAGVGTALTFEIGDATGFTPVGISFGTVLIAGNVTASTTPGEHPDIGNSGLAPGRDVNRFWTLTNSGTAFDNDAATFTFLAGDVDPGADVTTFIVAKRDGGAWTLPAVGARTPLTTQATGMTSFSEFAVGEPTADLAVTADDGLASVTAGDGLSHSYAITVTNAGPSDATGATLDIAWPSAFSQGAVSASQGSCSPSGGGPDLTCALGTLSVGSPTLVTIAYNVPLTAPGGVASLVASVASAVVDPLPGNDTATDTTTVVELATLEVSKDDGLISVTAGDRLSHGYTITVTNDGPSDADNLVLDDVVPAALTVGVPTADLAGDCTASIGNAIHCGLPASLDPGTTWTISVPYTVGPGAAAQTLTNTATATSDENPGGVTGTDTTDIVVSADLAVTADDGLASVTAGDGLSHSYAITVTNAGPSDATGATLDIAWPSAFSQGAVSASQGSCSPSGGGPDLTCALGTLSVGSPTLVTIAYNVPLTAPGGVASLVASVASAVVDPLPGNDTATDTTTVVELATLEVSKDDGLISVTAGDRLSHGYTITVTNDGPSDADNLVLDDVVPAALTVGVPTADLAGDCTASIGNAIHCGLPASLDPGTTWTISVPYTVGPGAAAQTLTNTATATSDENPGGVTGTDTTDIVVSADLAVTADDGLASVTAGDGLSHSYAITVTNAGPSDATGATLDIAWPSAFSQGAVSASQGSCSPSGGGPDLTCALGTLSVGSPTLVTIAYNVPLTAPGGVASLVASVASAVVDPLPGNDTATDTTTVVEVPLPSPPQTSAISGSTGAPPAESGWAWAIGLLSCLWLIALDRARHARQRVVGKEGVEPSRRFRDTGS